MLPTLARMVQLLLAMKTMKSKTTSPLNRAELEKIRSRLWDATLGLGVDPLEVELKLACVAAVLAIDAPGCEELVARDVKRILHDLAQSFHHP